MHSLFHKLAVELPIELLCIFSRDKGHMDIGLFLDSVLFYTQPPSPIDLTSSKSSLTCTHTKKQRYKMPAITNRKFYISEIPGKHESIRF